VTALFEKSGTLLAAHAKCGLTTFTHALPQYAVEHADPDPSHYSRIILSMREPLSRLLSAWRMFYVTLAGHKDRRCYLPTDTLQGKRLNHYLRSIKPRSHYLYDPRKELERFCESKLSLWLVKHDPHFQSQTSAYRHFYDLPNTVCVDGISQILHYFGAEPVRLNQGVWPWTALTVENFRTDVVERFLQRHYAEDAQRYGLCKPVTHTA